MPDDPYTDPATGVLRNKLGLATAAELDVAERDITHAALILLRESPVRPGYDLPHLREIHRRIFGDIYDWAGTSSPPPPKSSVGSARRTSSGVWRGMSSLIG